MLKNCIASIVFNPKCTVQFVKRMCRRIAFVSKSIKIENSNKHRAFGVFWFQGDMKNLRMSDDGSFKLDQPTNADSNEEEEDEGEGDVFQTILSAYLDRNWTNWRVFAQKNKKLIKNNRTFQLFTMNNRGTFGKKFKISKSQRH